MKAIQLSDDDLNVQNFKGQAHDNGVNMSRKYKGVHAKIMIWLLLYRIGTQCS